jgi:NAD(P)H-hydrate epimerase
MDLEEIAATTAEIREFDRRFIEEMGVPGVVLMENAGRGAAEIIMRLYPGKKIAVVCGKGNNGGDGYVVARHLHNNGYAVGVFLFAASDEIRGDAKTNLEIIRKMGLAIKESGEWAVEDLKAFEVVVDGLLGTGITGAVKDDYRKLIEEMNGLFCRKVALDIPSGLDGDTGEVLGATIASDHTITFAMPKKGFFKGGARKLTGEVHLVDIGISPSIFKK